MKASFLTAVFIWVCLSLIAGESYACKTPPLPEIVSPYIQNVCVGTDVEFDGVGSCVYETGSHDPDNESPYGCGHGINTYYWHYGDEAGEPYWHDDGGEPNHIYRTAGTYTVELKVKDDDNVLSDHNDTCTVYVVKVEKVVKYGYPDETGPLYRNLEGHVYLEAIPYPEGASFPTGEPHWTIEDPPEGSEPSLYDFGSGLALLSNLNVPGHYIVNAKCGEDDEGVTITVTVVTVEGLTWVTYPDDVVADPDHGPNITLSDCPKNPGKRIFPGKKCYEDSTEPLDHSETDMRQKVKIKATLSAAPDTDYDVYVIFKCWDVDDPCSSTPPLDEDDDDPDPNKHSIDNRGFFYFEGYDQSIYVWPESGSSVVDANFIVSYQPGDNYRITATTRIVTKHNDITHYMVDTNSLPPTVKRSDMLTTWRKLWIEQDSMGAVPETGNEKNHVAGTASHYEPYDQSHDRTWIHLGQNLPGPFDDENQFKYGRYVAGPNTYTTYESTAYWLDPDKVKVKGDPNGDGVPMVYKLYDDDETTLPKYPSLGSWASVFHAAYIEPNYLPETYSTVVPFDRNLSITDVADGDGTWNDDYNCPSSSSFWTELAVGAFQPETSKDLDPDTETEEIILGAAKVYGDDNQCVLYYETIRDRGVAYNTYQQLAHEIGHGAGIEDNECEEGCLMWLDEYDQLGDNFCDACQLEMRKDSTY